MPPIQLSDETYHQLAEFERFSAAATDLPMPLAPLADYLIQVGIEHMVTAVLTPQDPETLLSTILQMARHHPEPTFRFLTDILQRGKAINDAQLAEFREQMQRRIGFQPPTKPEK